MPRDLENEDEEDEEDCFGEDGYDPDDPETYPHGLYADNGPAIIPCPHCGKGVLEDSEQCPSCRMYLSKEDMPGKPRSGMWLILAILALLAALIWIVGGG
jgi:predicted nucleic acid-binding Zn ribbon protein